MRKSPSNENGESAGGRGRSNCDMLSASKCETGEQVIPFQAVVESFTDGLIVLDNDYRCTYANEAAATFLRTTLDKLIGRIFWEVVAQWRYPQLHEQITRAAEQKVSVKFEEYCQTCEHWYEWRCYPTDTGLTIFFDDATEHKQVEEQVAQSEQHYRLLFETMPQGVVYQDADGKIISMNPSAERILGRTPAEFLGRTSADEDHHTLREDGSPFPASEHPSMVALRTGQEVRNVVMGVCNLREQAYRWINITAVPLIRPGEDKPYQVYTHFADITELRQAEKALRNSERRFRKLFEADLMGVFITKLDGTFLNCNDALVKMLGYDSREEVLSHRSLDFYVDPEFRQEAIRMLQTEGVYLGKEGRVWRKDGSIAHLLGAAVLLKDEETGEPYVQGVAVDVTERRRTEDALRDSEERYRKLFESNLAGVYVTKLDGTIVDFNDAMMRMLGYDTREEVFQHKSTDFYADPEFRKELIYLLHRDGIVPGKEALLQRKDGSPLYTLGAGALLTNERTGERYIQGVAVDITERKEAEERIARSLRDMEFLSVSATRYLEAMPSSELFQYTAQQLQAVAGHAVIMVSEYDPDTNQTTLRALAGPADKLRKVPALLGRDPIGLALTVAEGTLERVPRGRLGHVEGGLYDLAFHQVPLPVATRIEQELGVGDVYAMPFYLGGDFMGTVAVAADRAEGLKNRELIEAIVNQAALALKRTRTEEALRGSEQALRDLTATLEAQVARRTGELEHRARQLQKLMLELSEAEDRERKRVADILHDDLQQILAAAKFHLGLLDIGTRSSEESREIARQVRQMLKDAIEKSRSLSHELSPAVLYQSDLEDTFHWLARQMQSKYGLTVHLDVRGPIDLESKPLRALLYKATQELLFNVVKHARTNEARIRLRRVGRCICLSVSDRGRGFDPEQLQEVAGFGLLSIQERVRLLGGRMKIKSTRGKGSTFYIVVPYGELPGKVVEIEPLLEGRAEAATRARREGNGRLRVLLADDHEIVRQGIASLLSEQPNIEVVGQASNGREAINLSFELRPDVVVMDVSMPLMNGDEATRQIKRHVPGTRVVALSMYDETETIERMREAGAESYVLKTAPSEELLAAIRGKQSTG